MLLGSRRSCHNARTVTMKWTVVLFYVDTPNGSDSDSKTAHGMLFLDKYTTMLMISVLITSSMCARYWSKLIP